MKITKIETIWFKALPQSEWKKKNQTSRQASPNNLWVRIYTDDGLVGLGETYYTPRAIASVIHDVFAPLLVGRNALDRENHWSNMFAIVNFCGFSGAEMRAISAIDIALWDIAGQAAGQPIYDLLGGRSRDRIAAYNTCVNSGKYADYDNVMNGNAGKTAKELIKQGTRAMKIWPFDQFGTTLAGPSNPRGPVVMWGGATAAGT